jgi:hypothetical protein
MPSPLTLTAMPTFTGSAGSDFPITAGAFQSTVQSAAGGAAVVVKLSPGGDSLVYSTFLGGLGAAMGTAIAVDQAGNAFVTGVADPGFPFTAGSWEDHFGTYPLSVGGSGALQPIPGAFVTKLNSTGTALLYSTLVDQGTAGITLSSNGQAYVVGGSLPGLPPFEQFTLAVGDLNSAGTVVTRLTPDGSQADLTVFLGCLTIPYSSAGLIALDSRNDILVAGSTQCRVFPAGTNGAFQASKCRVRRTRRQAGAGCIVGPGRHVFGGWERRSDCEHPRRVGRLRDDSRRYFIQQLSRYS